MLIQEWMSRVAITVDHNESLDKAIKLFEERLISLLPVMKEGKLIGIISDGNVKKASPSDATTLDRFEMATLLESVKVSSIMTKPVVTVRPDHTVAEAAQVMLNNSISGLPVVNQDGKIEGIITKSDIFRCYVNMTGISSNSQIFAFKLFDKPGVIKNFTDKIRASGGRISSILTSFDPVEPAFRKIYIHTSALNSQNFDSLSFKFNLTGELYFAADLSRGLRTTYRYYQ